MHKKIISNAVLSISQKRAQKNGKFKENSENKSEQIKKKPKSKDEDLKYFLANIYNYLTNDSEKLDESHQKLFENLEKNQMENEINENFYDETDYLTEVELAEIRNNYQKFELGDYLLVFPNPDQIKKNRPVTYKEALGVFDQVFGKSKENLNKKNIIREKVAFIKAFQDLEDYVKKENETDLENEANEEETKILAKKEELQKSDKKNGILKNMFKKKNDKKLQTKEETLKNQNTFESQLLKEEEDLLEKDKFTDEEMKDLKLLFTKLAKVKNVKKKFCQGGYLQRKIFSDRKDAGYDYLCKNARTNDFLTLIRNFIITKLALISKIHTRLFLSSSGKDILLVLNCDQNVLEQYASMVGMTKEMELGACDLLSLEPVDGLMRPLRLKNFLKLEDQEEKVKNLPDDPQKNKEKKENLINLGELADSIEERILNHNNDLQNACRGIYKDIKVLSKEQIRMLLIDKSCKINDYLKNLVKAYKIQVPDTKTEIQNDSEITREEWNAYFIYLCYLEKYFHLLTIENKGNKQIENNILFLLKLVFRKAVGDSNEIHDEIHKANFLLYLLGIKKKKSILKTIWNKLQMNPSAPFSKFFMNEKSKDKESNSKKMLWRSYERSERGERSIFLNMEKMKIINDIILSHFNISYLIKHQYLDSFFPLHNYYEMNLEKTRKFFNPLVFNKIIKEIELGDDVDKLKEIFTDLADEAENTDFISKDNEGSFINGTKFNIRMPWYISIDAIRNYFGEKIAIYFSFLSFYTIEIFPMAIIGLFAQIFIYLDMQSDAIKLSFSILIIVWSTVFIEMWKRRQHMFAVKYGQLDFQEEEAEQPDFKGEYTRSIADDNFNLTYFNSNKKKIRMIFSFVVSLLILCMVVFCVYGIFYLKSLAFCYNEIDNQCVPIDNNEFVQILLTILNTVQIMIFNKIYAELALKLNKFENHKLLSSYENSLVLKIFFFNFINTFFSLIFVAFFDSVFPLLNLCKGDSCYGALSRQMMIIFLTFYGNNVGEILGPFVSILLNKQAAKKKEIQNTSTKYFLRSIDEEIEKDYMKTNYHPSLEIDGTVADYMEMVIQFGFLNLFGTSFPLAFLLAFLNDIAEIQVDKLKLVQFKRRPVPKGAANIGTWLIILDLISFCAIFFNVGIIIITAEVASGSSISNLFLFIVLLLIFLGLKFFIRYLIPDFPSKAKILTERHRYVIEKCNSELQVKKNNDYFPTKGSTVIENVEEYIEGGTSNPTEGKSMEKNNFLREISIDKKTS